LTNVLVSGNVASSGGGIYNYNASVLTLTNVTISGNYGYGIYSSSSQMKAYNTIVWGNTNGISGSGATYTNCLIQGQNPAGTGNLDGTLVTSLNIPNFINPVLATSGSPTIEGDFRLEACSPCVDKGSDSIYLAHVGASNFDNQTDAAGIARRHGLSIDMGAYEFDGFEYTPDANGRLYVNKSVSGGTGNGSSWDNAMPELATALIFARTHAEVNEIWVASGTYKPLYHASAIGCADGGRDNAFVLVAGVKIYGGFAGTETSLAQRNLAANKCILSGDIGTEDVDTDNCYHVVIVAGSMISGADTARLDGFSIIHGNADGGSSTLTVNGQSVSRRNGGGISLTYSSPNLVYLEIRGNNAYYGGGLYAGNSSPKLTNVLVCGNRANYGGGIYVGGSAGVPTLTNVTVSGNYVSTNTNGSGIYIYNCQLKAYNTIVWGNTVATDTNGSATYTNCLISGLNPEGTGNLDGTLVTGINIPTFINPQAATSSSPTIEGDFRLEACSPCVDRGNDSIYLEHVGIADFTNQTDVAGIARRHGLRIDMGAYEFDGFEYTPDANGRLYVNKSVSGGNSNGSSWDNAMPELATALIFARTHAEVNEIWVASGTYKPLYHASAIGCADGGRDNAFVLVPGVKVYGGFAGTETSLAQRNLAANKCILSGDIGTEDVDTDNSYHIVISAGDVGDARLDGFSIIHGRATGSSTVTVNGHSINMYGAGIHIVNSSPDLVNLEIRGNMTASNSNDHGGGICINGSSPKLTNVLVSGNAAGGSGGGIYFLGGGISTFTNVTVSGNATPNGSGIYINSGQMNAYNSIVWGNSTVVAAGSSATYTYCLIDGLNPAGTGNLNGIEANNPLFVNPQSATVYIPTIEGDFQLEACSPCVNQGYNATYLTNAGIADFNGEKDVAGNPRLSGSAIDMGAYEFDNSAEISVSPDANGRVYVTVSGAGNKDGSSWANAYPGLADPLLAAQSKACTEIKKIKEIWVARGRYLPLHKAGNGTSDKDKAFVIAAGVRIYGGFAGTETLLSERNLAQNPSILSGDNSYHTVISAGSMISGTDTARLDGFVVRNGKAKGSGTITVNGQSISANSGGGIYFANSSPNIVNVEIKGSEASAYGGGIYAYNSSPKLINAVVSGNLSASGGGIYLNGGSPALTNITVSGNRATTSGGGIYTNNSSPQIGNSIVWGNAAGSSNNVYSAGGSPAYQYSLIQDLNPSGAGNINGTNPSNAPAFMHPVSASAAPSIDGYYRPQLGSPALNAGNNALNREPTDIESAPRIQESQIELGAYEVNYNFECNCE
jgi:predicted outer membrane repeat protein